MSEHTPLTEADLHNALALWLCEEFEDDDGLGCEPEAGPPCIGHVVEASQRLDAFLAARTSTATADTGSLPGTLEYAQMVAERHGDLDDATEEETR